MILNVLLSCKFRAWGITFGSVAPPAWNIPIAMALVGTRLLIAYNERGVMLTVHLVNPTTDPVS